MTMKQRRRILIICINEDGLFVHVFFLVSSVLGSISYLLEERQFSEARVKRRFKKNGCQIILQYKTLMSELVCCTVLVKFTLLGKLKIEKPLCILVNMLFL